MLHCTFSIAMSPAPTSFFCICNCNSMEEYIEHLCSAMNLLRGELHCITLYFLNHNVTNSFFCIQTVIHWNNILNSSAIVNLLCSLLHCSFSITMTPAPTSFFCIHHQTAIHQNNILNTLCFTLHYTIVLCCKDGSCIHHFS